MSFLYPSFLFALLAVSIPIIIHLFNFRKFKRVLFTNVRFLKEVKQETQSRNKLKHLLILISRILAITFLVFAFAQPFIPAENNKVEKGKKSVSIYIDNSFSMDAVNENGRLLDQAIKYAEEIANTYNATDEFQLLTNDFEGKHQRLVNREVFIEYLEDVVSSPTVHSISEVINRQKNAMENRPNQTAYLISDFQKNNVDFENTETDSTLKITAVPLQAELKNNVFIDSVWFDTPIRQVNQPEKLTAKIVNNSEGRVENIPIKLNVNKQQKALSSFSAEPNTSADSTVSFTLTESGFKNAAIKLTDHPITFDDEFFLSFEVAENIPVLCISQKDSTKYLRTLFGKDPFFQLTWMFEGQINYSDFEQNQLIVLADLNTISSGLAQELIKFTENGGSILIFPGADIEKTGYNELAGQLNMPLFTNFDTSKTNVADINLTHPIYENVFEDIPKNINLPAVFGSYKTTNNLQSNQEKLLITQKGDAFLSQYSYKKGKVYLCTSPLSEKFSGFVKHAIYVPTLYRIALLSQPSPPLYYTIGENNIIEIAAEPNTTESVFHLVNDKGFDVIPEHRVVNNRTRIFVHGQVKEAGNYFIKSGDSTLAAVAFNYNRKESNMELLSIEQLQEEANKAGITNFSLINANTTKIANAVLQISEGTQLWRLCILLVLLFLAIEILLIKFWK